MSSYLDQPKVKLLAWPTPQEYNEALQNAQTCFCDSELKSGIPETTALGLPRPITGAFASVYKLCCQQGDWAVRCFLYNIADQQERYAKISEHLRGVEMPYTVEFNYLPEGVRLHAHWYPILKMQWVEGLNLHEYIRQKLTDSPALTLMAERMKCLVWTLKSTGIAHGDLQHGNVLVVGDHYKLVDYDGMYVASLSGRPSNELGHRNYQHPGRTKDHFGMYLDNFSAWVIYTSLVALSVDAELWRQLRAGDECLLFRSADLCFPQSSLAFSILENHENQQIVKLTRLIRSFLDMPVEKVPDLDPSLPEPENLPPMPKPGEMGQSLPDWIQHGAAAEPGVRHTYVPPASPWRSAPATSAPKWPGQRPAAPVAHNSLPWNLGVTVLFGMTCALLLFIAANIAPILNAQHKQPVARSHKATPAPDTTRANQLSDFADSFYDTGNFAKAAELYGQSLAALNLAGTTAEEAQTADEDLQLKNLSRQGYCENQLNDYKKGQELYEQALNLESFPSAPADIRAYVYTGLAVALDHQGNYAGAKAEYGRALSLVPKSDTTLRLGILENMAQMYQRMGQYIEAETLLDDAKLVDDKRTDWRTNNVPTNRIMKSLADNSDRLLAKYFAEGNFDKARVASMRALTANQSITPRPKHEIARSFYNLAMVDQKLTRYDEAEQLCKEGLEICRGGTSQKPITDEDYRERAVKILRLMSDIYDDLGQGQEVKQATSEANQLQKE